MTAELEPPVQYGGGLRTLGAVHDALEAGARRVVLGTAALRDEALLGSALELAGPDRVVVAVDVRGGRVSVAGWTEASDLRPEDLVARLERRGRAPSPTPTSIATGRSRVRTSRDCAWSRRPPAAA
jgi:Phosphoribosylformimino-5-aminoimidazole carboxamide ribonucleotide (ProFAR) isomerase